MERVFTPELASFYESFYADKGVKMLKGDLVTALEGEGGHVTTAVLKSGARVPTSLVVVGTGARPNVELLSGQVEMVEGPPGGIKTDGRFRTSAPDIWAIGDVAAFPLKLTGRTVRQEHVTNSRLSGAHAIADILAPETVSDYDYLPFFYSRIFSLSWQLYGLSEGEVVLHGDPKSGKFGAFWVKEGHVVGAFLEGGSNDEFAAIKKAVQQRAAAPADLQSQGLAWAAKL